MRKDMVRSTQLPVHGALATARLERRLHLANMHVRVAEARELHEEARALRAEAQLMQHTATLRRGDRGAARQSGTVTPS